MQDCSAAHNGRLNTSPGGGPVGIWAWDSKEIVIERCLSAANASCGNDGGGYDLDGGCSECVVQDCVSMDNYGPGFLISSYPGSAVTRNCIIRHNSSILDNQGGKAASLYVWGGDNAANAVQDIWFQQNIVQVIPGHNLIRVERIAERIHVE